MRNITPRNETEALLLEKFQSHLDDLDAADIIPSEVPLPFLPEVGAVLHWQ